MQICISIVLYCIVICMDITSCLINSFSRVNCCWLSSFPFFEKIGRWFSLNNTRLVRLPGNMQQSFLLCLDGVLESFY